MDIKHCILECDWLKGITHGWGSGYVAVPKGHPMFEMSDDEIHNNFEIQIHGGLTFASLIKDKDRRFPADFVGMWVIGFDCNHYGDSPTTCPKEYVEAEALRLMEQVKRCEFSDAYWEDKLKKAAPQLLTALKCVLIMVSGHLDQTITERSIEDVIRDAIKGVEKP